MEIKVGGAFRIRPDLTCQTINFSGQGGNPAIEFELNRYLPRTILPLSPSQVSPIDTKYFRGENTPIQELVLTSNLSHPLCSSIPEQTNDTFSTVLGLYDGDYWIHDPRFVSMFSSGMIVICFRFF
jgi:hypothetical protein